MRKLAYVYLIAMAGISPAAATPHATETGVARYSPVPRLMLAQRNCRLVQQWVQECSRSCTRRPVRQGGVIIYVQDCQSVGCYRYQQVCS